MCDGLKTNVLLGDSSQDAGEWKPMETQEASLLQRRNDRSVALWLLVCCGMIFFMVSIGGVTRLTRSGLSMVTWKPIRGTLPPLNRAQWEAEFARYQQFPEYKKINKKMNLAQFKSIFWMEYFHRLWGRLIGLVFFLPFLYLLIRRKIRKGLIPKLLLMFVGGGMQGLLGWYMVKSGLVNKPHVSQYRLTAHLFLAFLLYAYILWVALGLLWSRDTQEVAEETPLSKGGTSLRPLLRGAWGLFALVGVMVMSGGFVAGLRAGLAYNTFPKMGAHWIPTGLFSLQPMYRNFFENVATVQLMHRMIAYALCVSIPLFVWWARRYALSARARTGLFLLLGGLAVQVTLGICTLLWFVPVSLAALHQLGALCLFTFALLVVRELSLLVGLGTDRSESTPSMTSATPSA